MILCSGGLGKTLVRIVLNAGVFVRMLGMMRFVGSVGKFIVDYRIL